MAINLSVYSVKKNYYAPVEFEGTWSEVNAWLEGKSGYSLYVRHLAREIV